VALRGTGPARAPDGPEARGLGLGPASLDDDLVQPFSSHEADGNRMTCAAAQHTGRVPGSASPPHTTGRSGQDVHLGGRLGYVTYRRSAGAARSPGSRICVDGGSAADPGIKALCTGPTENPTEAPYHDLWPRE